MGRQYLLALLLCGLTAAVFSQTTDGSATVTPWIAPSDILCYTCDNEPDNDVCNGKDLGGNGSLTVCEGIPDPTCVTHTKFNENGDGWSFEKRCMDYTACEDEYFAQFDDPMLMSCMATWYHYNPPPYWGMQCVWCCWKDDYDTVTWDFNACNEEGYNWHWEKILDENKWDHAVDRWPGHEKAGYPLQDDNNGSASAHGVDSLFFTECHLADLVWSTLFIKQS
ncbi:uncharacterized protein [Amphiura filiformis]|uniref:uncharacterized protein n=1 Tax=Amphiura filiformis TaxID=82378 RepID=UPI003B21EA0C